MLKYSINSQRPHFKLIHYRASYYYNHADFSLHRSNFALLVTVKFPVSSMLQPYKLFEIIHYPVPLNNSSTHTTYINNLPRYIALSESNFISLPADALNECTMDKHSTNCHVNFPVQDINQPDCAMSLLSSNKSAVKDNCDFKFSPNSLQPTLRQLNQTLFLAVNNSDITLKCDNSIKEIESCHFCLIQIPCNCSIKSKHFTLPRRHTDCHFHSDVTTMHPVNLILLQHFFNETETREILPNSTFPQPLNITVKPFQIYENKFRSVVANDKKLNLDLKKMIDYAKEDKIIYQDLSEPFLDSSTFNDSNTTIIALALISLIVSVCCFIIIFIIFLKYRSLASAMLIYKAIPKTAAANLPSFHYTPNKVTTTPSTSQLEDFHSSFNEFNEYVIFALAVLFCIYLVYKRLKPYNRPQLYIEVSNGKQCAFCPILYLPTCVRNVCVKQSRSPTVTLRLGLFPTLEINWNHLQIQVTNPSFQLHLPTSCKVNLLRAITLQQILENKEPYQVQLWVTHNKFCIPLETEFLTPTAPNDDDSDRQKLLYPKLNE